MSLKCLQKIWGGLSLDLRCKLGLTLFFFIMLAKHEKKANTQLKYLQFLQ